jgi:hypothetical protein
MCNHLDDMSENKTLQVLTFDHHLVLPDIIS